MKIFPFLLSLILTSCATNSGTGLIAGTIVGASVGGISAGKNGALIGSAAGAIIGGVIGAILDTQDRKVMEYNSPRTVDRMDRGDPLTINDVIKLSQAKVSDDTIILYIKQTYSSYNLSKAQVRRLQDAGVSSKVINEMITTTHFQNS